MSANVKRLRAALAGAMALLTACAVPPAAAQRLPAPLHDEAPGTAGTWRQAVVAGGCFWGVQGVFEHVEGVGQAVSGYAGGASEQADYETVSTGTTGHAESVRIDYDPSRISYGQLLQIFFSVAHDPTQRNRQGPDSGTQYRSAVFPQDEEQTRIARAYVAQLDDAHVFAKPLATAVEPGQRFYPAEAYHQNFLDNNPTYAYIALNDLPKIDALKRDFPERYRAQAVRVPEAGAR